MPMDQPLPPEGELPPEEGAPPPPEGLEAQLAQGLEENPELPPLEPGQGPVQ